MLRQAICAILLALLATSAATHEIRPSIADFRLEGRTVRLDIATTLEALVAGLDLTGLADTNEAAGAERYDALRALAPEELVRRTREAWPGIAAQLAVEADGRSVPLQLEHVEAAEIGDTSLPRDGLLVVRAELPAGAREARIFWPAAYGPLILRQQGVSAGLTEYLEGGGWSSPFALGGGSEKSAFGVFAEYVPVGFDHILPKGLDHILFVLGLFFLSLRLRPLLAQVTLFTLAHTVTLALGATGAVSISPAIVEPLIAASIVFVAVENLFTDGLNPWRPVVVFGFGLLHGLGFASVLEEFGLPPGHFLPALLGFNVGVELGQLTVIGLAFVAVGLWFGRKSWYRPAIAMPASAAIALVGAWWVLDRTVI